MRHQVASRDHQSPIHQCAHHLPSSFTVDAPNTSWVTNITCIPRCQGGLYLAVVVDLHARRVVGWSIAASLSRVPVLGALFIAVLCRKPHRRVVVHSGQGNQYGSDNFRRFCQAYNLGPGMSRRAIAAKMPLWNRSSTA